jgi:DNA-directed RNA polymerase specialized sigma24 family protein
MPVDDQLLSVAREFDRQAMERLLAAVYSPVYRIAHGLSGRQDVARGIIRFIMNQALKRMPQWRDGQAADRWFFHHTVLTSRRAVRYQPKPQDDVLVRPADSPDAAYLAFIRALRALPMQQREAFILHHGEHFNVRHLAIAMDCSTKAAEMHLASAHQALEPIGGAQFPAMRDRMAQAYAALAPSDEVIRPLLRRCVRRSIWPRRLKRALKLLIGIVVIAASAFAAMRFRHLLPWP